MTRTTASPIGAHTFIWSPVWGHAGACSAATRGAQAGFDLIEIPLLDPSVVDVGDTVHMLDGLGLGCTCSLGLPADAHLLSAPGKALSFLTRAVDVAAELGSRWLTGVLYGSLGTLTGSAPTGDELDTTARSGCPRSRPQPSSTQTPPSVKPRPPGTTTTSTHSTSPPPVSSASPQCAVRPPSRVEDVVILLRPGGAPPTSAIESRRHVSDTTRPHDALDMKRPVDVYPIATLQISAPKSEPEG